jgi:hypothetical protein
MGAAEDMPPLQRVRAALADRVEHRSLREAAREVGMSPSGLRKVLDGARPYSSTRRKLHAWYVREGVRSYGETDASSALSALDLLVGALPSAPRARTAREIVETLRRGFEAASLLAPEWLDEAAERFHYP